MGFGRCPAFELKVVGMKLDELGYDEIMNMIGKTFTDEVNNRITGISDDTIDINIDFFVDSLKEYLEDEYCEIANYSGPYTIMSALSVLSILNPNYTFYVGLGDCAVYWLDFVLKHGEIISINEEEEEFDEGEYEIDGWIEDKKNVSNYIDYVRLSFLKSAS